MGGGEGRGEKKKKGIGGCQLTSREKVTWGGTYGGVPDICMGGHHEFGGLHRGLAWSEGRCGRHCSEENTRQNQTGRRQGETHQPAAPVASRDPTTSTITISSSTTTILREHFEVNMEGQREELGQDDTPKCCGLVCCDQKRNPGNLSFGTVPPYAVILKI